MMSLARKIGLLACLSVSISIIPAQANPNSVTESTKKSGPLKTVYHDLSYAGRTFASDTWYLYSAPARLTKRGCLWAGGLAAVGGIIYAYDREIFDAIHRNKDHALYKPIRKTGEAVADAGHMGKTNIYYFGLLGASYLVGIESLTALSAEILEAHFISGAGKNLGKYLVGRHRPHEKKGHRSFSRNDGTSFPSGHSINIMELAAILSRYVDYLPFQIACFGLAGSVCLERITEDQHWPSDVYVAAVFGTITAKTILDRHRPQASSHQSLKGGIGGGESIRSTTDRLRWRIHPVISHQDKFVGMGFTCWLSPGS